MFYLKKLVAFFLFATLCLHANSFQSLTSFEANFTQTIINPSGTKAVYKGALYIQEPNKITWEYKDPFEKYIYIKKYTVTIIEPDLEQVIVSNLQKEINVIELLKSAVQTSSNSFVSNYNNVEYKLLLQNKLLHQISYEDELENNVTISFENVKENQKIDENVFKFFIPDYYDIIKK